MSAVSTSRSRAYRSATRLTRSLAWLVLRLLPPQRHAVVHGWPDSEGNAVEVVRALRRRYRGTVVWLLDDPDYAGPSSAVPELRAGPGLRRLRKNSPAAIWYSLTAELTLFTHGLYTAVRPPRSRLVVNLWHGDGPKITRDVDLIRSTVVVSGSRLWGDYKLELFGLGRQALALTGNPRTDQFAEPVPPAALAQLGLRAAGPRVLWLPTYRQARGPRSRQWSDGEGLTGSDDVQAIARALAGEAEARGVELLVKPHPLDADDYGALGIRVLRDEQLRDAGVTLYQLMGSCTALLSDISSAWVDYLVLDRPIAFFVPDLADRQARGLLNVPDLEALLPGPRLLTPEQARAFLGAVVAGEEQAQPSRWPGTTRIGPVVADGRA
jgi:CDP-glycerol glycerophosphotransferase